MDSSYSVAYNISISDPSSGATYADTSLAWNSAGNAATSAAATVDSGWRFSDWAQAGLNALGNIPEVGVLANSANAAISPTRSNYTQAAMYSGAAALSVFLPGAAAVAEGGELLLDAASAAEAAEELAPALQAAESEATGSGRVFYGTPQGQLIEAPPGYEPLTAQNGKGLVLLSEGQPLGNNANIIRWSEPNALYPNGSFRYYNNSAQPLIPGTGILGPDALTHIAPDYQGPLVHYPGTR